MDKKTRIDVRQVALHLVLAGAACVMVVPFIWQILTAFKSIPESRAVPPVVFPSEFLTDGFVHFFTALPVGRLLTISGAALVLRVLGQLIVCSLAAYGFARFRFPGRECSSVFSS